ncbi:hypothetical protein [Arthrobacter sp. H41]|uniref:hypothetical protein n=1 Tax=Arthrobacter sp. H41 TaxID=1312978 RepID=UPI00047DDC27|nr:hypothetical protein [Arthrobacter sp. H41]
MDTTTIEEQLSTEQSVELVRSQLVVIGKRFEAEACFTSTAELAGSLAALEDLARTGTCRLWGRLRPSGRISPGWERGPVR